MADLILDALNPTGKKESKPGQINDISEAYSGAEGDNEISSLESALAGIASGIIKVPEGFVSLGAELLDFSGMTNNAAAKVESAFDTINIFEETAEARASGKILQALVQIGVPAGAGAKIASKLATKALKARKAGTLLLPNCLRCIITKLSPLSIIDLTTNLSNSEKQRTPLTSQLSFLPHIDHCVSICSFICVYKSFVLLFLV